LCSITMNVSLIKNFWYKLNIEYSIFETDATLFLDVSPTLGKLEGCGPEVLTTLATHAVRPGNYGPPRIWTREDLNTIGVVFAGLKPEAISTISPDSLPGLTPLAIRSTPSASLAALSSDQLSKMSYMAAKAIKKEDLATLSSDQKSGLSQVLSINETVFNIEFVPEVFDQRDIHGNGTQKGDDGEVTIEDVTDEENSKVKSHHDPADPVLTTNSTTLHANSSDPNSDPSAAVGSPSSSASSKLKLNFLFFLLAQFIYYLKFSN